MAAIGTLPVVLQTGDHASRPAASAVGAGGLYSCTDHSLLYQTDGSSWTTWATLGGSGDVATDAIWDAKGDLAGGTGANTAAKLTVGTNGDVLTADSGETTGMKWATPSGGFTPEIARYIDTAHASYTTTSTTFVDLDSASNLTITTGARRVLLGCTLSAENSGGSSTCFDFTVDGTRQGGTAGLTLTNLGPGSVAWTYLTDVLSAASHTFKIQWKVTANTGTVHMAAAGGALHFWAIEQGA